MPGCITGEVWNYGESYMRRLALFLPPLEIPACKWLAGSIVKSIV